MTATEISARNIYPPHEVQDPAKLAALTAALEADGWQGRPLLVLEVAGDYQAITGSHRIAAAKAAGLEELPCVEIDAEAFYGAGYEASDLWDDEVRLSILREIGDEAAAHLMQMEIDANA